MSRVLVAITSFALILTMGTVGSIQASGQGVTHYYVSLGDSR